jgi:hypothetical protein
MSFINAVVSDDRCLYAGVVIVCSKHLSLTSSIRTPRDLSLGLLKLSF